MSPGPYFHHTLTSPSRSAWASYGALVSQTSAVTHPTPLGSAASRNGISWVAIGQDSRNAS
jgi:enterochelin esterase-like enzyme